ncbi:MAG: radical SAM protein [Polyangiaceae bacterium]|nr:radical SAM protein [Polyangiaceae bacterium]
MAIGAHMLDVEVTRRCNLRCDYCFVGWSRDWTSDLPFETACAVVDDGAGLFDTLHITGGEPFVYKGLFDLIDRALSRGYKSVLINTNGTFLTPGTVHRLSQYQGNVALTVSLDGPPALHDPIRGEGRYAEAEAGIARVLAAGIQVSVMVVITPSVLNVLWSFVRDVYAKFPTLSGVTFFPVGVGPEGSAKPGARVEALSPDQVRELVLTTALLWRSGMVASIGAYPIVNPLLKALGMPEKHLYQCTAGRGRVCVHADGSVSSCHPVKDPLYGTFHPGLFRRLPGLETHARLAGRLFEGCAECGHREACGHCRAFVSASGEPLFGNDGACQSLLPMEGRPVAARMRRKLHVIG